MNCWDYPIGSDTSFAPWNQTDMTDKEYEQYQDEKEYFEEIFYDKDDI